MGKDRRTARDLAEKAKTHKGLWCPMMIFESQGVASAPSCTLLPAYLSLMTSHLHYSFPCSSLYHCSSLLKHLGSLNRLNAVI